MLAVADTGLVAAGAAAGQGRERLGHGAEAADGVQRHPCGGDQLDLAGVAAPQGLGGCHPLVVDYLAVVDGDLVGGGFGREEPRREALGGDRRRDPVGEVHEVFRVEHDGGFLVGLAGRRVAGGRDQVAGAVMVAVVDAAAGEHPHPAEGEAGVSAQHQRLGAVGTVAQHHHGCGWDGRGLAVPLELFAPLLEEPDLPAERLLRAVADRVRHVAYLITPLGRGRRSSPLGGCSLDHAVGSELVDAACQAQLLQDLVGVLAVDGR